MQQPNQPTRIALRQGMPLEILDRAFRIYRENFRLIILLVGLSTLIVTIFNLVNSLYIVPSITKVQASSTYNASAGATTPQVNALNALFAGLGWTLVAAILILLVQAFLINAPLTYLASERLLGREVSIEQAYLAVLGRLWRLGIALLLFYVIMGVLIVASYFTLGLCGVGLGVMAFVFTSFYPFVVPVFVLERTGLMRGMGRAWFLAKMRLWPLLGISFAVLIIIGLVEGGLYVLGLSILGSTFAAASSPTFLVIETLLQAVIGIFIAPVLPIVYTMMYYDTRIRFEGLDISLNSIRMANPRPSDLVSPPPGQFMSPQDWRNAALLGLLGVIPFLLIAFVFTGIVMSALGGAVG